MELLRQNAARIAAWLPLLAVIGALICGAAFMYALRTRRRWLQTIALGFFGFPVVALIVMFGPMNPLFSSARRLDSWIGRPAPDIVFRDVADGSERHLAAYRGRVVVVNLWATWCPPCREEMPALNRLQRAHGGRGLVVVTLSDEPPERMKRFLERHAPDTVNGVTTFEWLPIETFRPFTFIVDRNGVIRDYFFGSQEFEVFERRVNRYL